MNIFIILIIFIIVYIIYNNSNKNENFKNNIELNNLDLNNTNNLNNIDINNNFMSNNIDNKNIKINYDCYKRKSFNKIKELNYGNFKYKLIGKGVNKFYNQKYYLYESRKDQYGNLLIRDNLDYLNNQIYSYIFVKFNNNKPIVDHEFGPRNKINIGDIIFIDKKYLSNGISYIGPYIIL
jgi:hypothetical protein